MTNLILWGFICFSILLGGCQKKCKDAQPQARIINTTTHGIKVQIKDSNGNTVNVDNIIRGTSSNYENYVAGVIVFTISVNNNNYVKSIEASTCYDYDITIDENYNISTTAIKMK